MNPTSAEETAASTTKAERSMSAAAVAAFLEGHPDFFIKHRELLAALDLPHDCGDAVSLVEYQVSVLRDHNLRLRRQLDGLVANARGNEALIEGLHRLTLDLLASQDLAMALDMLDDVIRTSFKADFSAVRLLMDPPADERGRPEFLGGGDAVLALHAAVLRAEAPTCGRVHRALAESLFGGMAEELGSAVVAPLGRCDCLGVVAIGSRDASRYQPGMGTLFIRQLADVAGTVIQRHLSS